MGIVRGFEDRIFAFASEAEYRLKITPRGTRLVPTTLHRVILRFLVGGFLLLISVFAFTSGARRTHAILAVALGALLAALGLLAFDARRGMSSAAAPVRRPSPPTPARSAAPAPRKRP